jgi:muramoyltetrapeptide carboxypeptidase
MALLTKGDVVEIIVPASGCTKEEYKSAIEFVKKFGLTPKFHLYEDVVKSGLCANSVDYRFKHLMEAMESNDSKAVWCLKGGYGAGRLLEKLDEVDAPQLKKVFIGFSDITMLLNYFADKWGWECLHGPMPAQVGKIAETSWNNLSDIVFEEKNELSFSTVALNEAARSGGNVSGKLMGGCLSLMQTFIGTSHMPELGGAVLLLEDDKFETSRRIDRILDHMQRAGVFYDVEAVILGNFLESPGVGSENDLELKEVLNNFADYLTKRGIPLIQNKKIGHAEEIITVPIGGVAKISLGDKPEVSFK